MPYHFDFDGTNKIIRARLEGIITDEILKDYYKTAAIYGARYPTFSAILDMSAVTSLSVSPQTIRELAALPPAVPDPLIPRCIIAASPDIFGLARMFDLQGSSTRPNLHVVRTEREALAILGVKHPNFSDAEPQ